MNKFYFLIIILFIYYCIYKIYFYFYNINSYNIWKKNISRLKFLKYKKNIFLKYSNSIFNLYFKKVGIPPVNFNKFYFFNNSKKWIISLIRDINLSFKYIYIIIYIWEPGYWSDQVAISLIRASYRNVKCKIILDSFGSLSFFQTTWPFIMIKSGIKIIESLKINLFNIFFKRIDLRQHKKIVIIDDYIVYIGSANLIDSDNFKKYLNLGKWIDLMIKLKGRSITNIMKIIFSYDWELETGKNIINKDIYINLLKYNFLNKKNKYKDKNVQILTSGPGLPNNLIHKFLLDLIFSAKKKLIIITPYFIPTQSLLDAICIVSEKGVDVKIILPIKNDSFLLYWANRYFIENLLLSNIKVYFFKTSFLHTKVILVDTKISVIGTINFDVRSIFLNFEITLVIYSLYVNKKIYYIYKKYISKSILLNLNIWRNRPLYEKFIENISFIFGPLL